MPAVKKLTINLVLGMTCSIAGLLIGLGIVLGFIAENFVGGLRTGWKLSDDDLPKWVNKP